MYDCHIFTLLQFRYCSTLSFFLSFSLSLPAPLLSAVVSLCIYVSLFTSSSSTLYSFFQVLLHEHESNSPTPTTFINLGHYTPDLTSPGMPQNHPSPKRFVTTSSILTRTQRRRWSSLQRVPKLRSTRIGGGSAVWASVITNWVCLETQSNSSNLLQGNSK